jgi:REase_DpnII-MboI
VASCVQSGVTLVVTDCSSNMFALMPKAPTRLTKSRDEAVHLLQERVDEALKIANDVRSRQEWERAVEKEKLWREYNCHLLETLFTTPEYADEYRGSVKKLRGLYDFDPSVADLTSRLAASIKSQLGALQSLINRIGFIEEESAAPGSEQPSDKPRWLVTLAERFHLVARQMQKRHDGRPTLELNDEYDFQDLFHALLTIFFGDIRPEEWAPSYAGAATKMDFLLPELETVVELKMTRPSLTTKRLGDELLVDIARYQTHPRCRTLYCVVYDPNGLISNPRGFEADMNGEHGNLVVQVMTVPIGT